MACGNIVIASDSGGIREYLEDDINGFIIDKINDTDTYINKLNILINNNDKYLKLKEEGTKTIKQFDFDKTVTKYIDYFNKEIIIKESKLNAEEMELYNKILDNRFRISNKNNKKIIYKIGKKLPKKIKFKIKDFSEKLYNFTNKY